MLDFAELSLVLVAPVRVPSSTALVREQEARRLEEAAAGEREGNRQEREIRLFLCFAAGDVARWLTSEEHCWVAF